MTTRTAIFSAVVLTVASAPADTGLLLWSALGLVVGFGAAGRRA